MKLEYLEGIDSQRPKNSLIRLYRYKPDEAIQLIAIFSNLAKGAVAAVSLEQQHFIEPIDGCRLLLKCATYDHGILRTNTDRRS